MSKKITVVCILTFLIGCAGGGALAYANHQKGLESQTLLASISQTQENWEVEQFIREQEEQRPEGMEESQIATGSKYTGITYNNVSVATADNNDSNDSSDALKNIEDNNRNNEKNKPEGKTASQDTMNTLSKEKMMVRVAIQNGSLNIRSDNSIGDNVIGQAYKDELLEIIQQDGVWYQVVTMDGVQGYVSSTYVEIITE